MSFMADFQDIIGHGGSETGLLQRSFLPGDSCLQCCEFQKLRKDAAKSVII
jgi:hypothetical protein